MHVHRWPLRRATVPRVGVKTIVPTSALSYGSAQMLRPARIRSATSGSLAAASSVTNQSAWLTIPSR